MYTCEVYVVLDIVLEQRWMMCLSVLVYAVLRVEVVDLGMLKGLRGRVYDTCGG